jgi:hypothetical protein
MKRRQERNVDSPSSRRFRRYALAAGGAVFGCTMSTTASDAGVIYHDPVDVTIGPGETLFFDLQSGAVTKKKWLFRLFRGLEGAFSEG